MTAQLPVVRVSSDSERIIYPFAAVGLDYFGPLYVKTGPNTRSKKNATLNKRYGCIFTCLRYRAVHIEVAEDLSTDSFINAVLRFVGRRGPPRIIYSDNGTNFRGAELDVIKALQVWDQEKIKTHLDPKRYRLEIQSTSGEPPRRSLGKIDTFHQKNLVLISLENAF